MKEIKIVKPTDVWNSYICNKFGGLAFLQKCYYNVNLFEANFPLCYRELSSTYRGEPRGKFNLWNNKDITIDQKTLSWKTCFEHGIYFVQDLLSKD